MATELLSPVYIGLGSNLDEPRSQIEAAMAALARLPQTRVYACSAIYTSPAMGPDLNQPDYLNAVAAMLSSLKPEPMLSALLELERELGRVRDGVKWGPRRIDLDLLLHGDTVLKTDALTLPHAGLVERAFVLQPLAQLAPGLRLPDGRRILELAQAIDCSNLKLLGELGQT